VVDFIRFKRWGSFALLFFMVFALTSAAAEGATDSLNGTWKITSGARTVNDTLYYTYESSNAPYVKIAVVEQESKYKITLNGGWFTALFKDEELSSWRWLDTGIEPGNANTLYRRMANGEYRISQYNGSQECEWETKFKVNGNQLQYTETGTFDDGNVLKTSVTLQREDIDSNHPSMLVPKAASKVNFKPNEKIVLKATLLTTLKETLHITRYHWRIYRSDPYMKASKAPVHILDVNHGGDAHEGAGGGGGEGSNYEVPVEVSPDQPREFTYDVEDALEEGNYVWHIQFKYDQAGQTGWTQWSELGSFSVGEVSSDGDSGGGGGCDVGLGFFAAGFAAVAYLYKKRRSAK
jgi:hypothetical protein